ncbi:MAG: ArnT family glycosyltransferase [Flavobacteriales bacterium]|jgi:4-amino-4-deoxy-L-arabinose transferase-like glycosyltransferase
MKILRWAERAARHTQAWHVFTLCFVVRFAWAFLSGINHTELHQDAGWILRLIDQTGAGHINYDIGRFISPPLYPFTGGLYKMAFGPWWLILFILTQVILSSISGVWLYRLALLHTSKLAAAITAVLFAFFPFTLWWTGTISSESTFQSLLIGAMYYLVLYTRTYNDRELIASSVLFSLAYLTKAHILLFAPMLAFYLWQNRRTVREGLLHASLYAAVCLIFSLPFGYHCLRTNGTYVLSSNGLLFHFYTGHHHLAYRTIVDVPEPGTPEYTAIQKFEFTPFNGSAHDSLMALPQTEKQAAYFREALNWIWSHPAETAQLKACNLFFFLAPGLSWRHYPLVLWAGSFLLTLPIYILAYNHLLRLRRSGKKDQYWFGYLFLTMLFFSVVFYVQNRFRTITLEPFYILFASAAAGDWMTRRINRGDTSHPGGL